MNFRRVFTALLLIVAAFHSAGAGVDTRYHDDIATVAATQPATLRADVLDGPYDEAFVVEVRAALESGRSWAIAIGDLTVALEIPDTRGSLIDIGGKIRLTATMADSTLWAATLDKHWGTGPHDENTLIVEISGQGELTIAGGLTNVGQVASIALDRAPRGPVRLSTDGELRVYLAVTQEFENPAAVAVVPGLTADALTAVINSSSDRLVGIWDYFDCDINTTMARRGGRYTLAIIPAEGAGDCYDVIYLAGAEAGADDWKPLMRKGRLKGTILEGTYIVEWLDSRFSTISTDVTAQFEQSALLTFNFPDYGTRLRFTRRPRRAD